jgi:hypothetical protein
MKPLHLQLEDRYSRLKEIRESLWNLESEALPSEMIERVGIDFYPLDVNTGATSDLVTPYFLPRLSYPSCRDLRADGELKDQIISEGQDRRPCPDYRDKFTLSHLRLTHLYYAFEQKKDLLYRVLDKK